MKKNTWVVKKQTSGPEPRGCSGWWIEEAEELGPCAQACTGSTSSTASWKFYGERRAVGTRASSFDVVCFRTQTTARSNQESLKRAEPDGQGRGRRRQQMAREGRRGTR